MIDIYWQIEKELALIPPVTEERSRGKGNSHLLACCRINKKRITHPKNRSGIKGSK